VISVQEAFKKFRSRLELTESEQQDASRRQKEIRAQMDESFHVAQDFLTGSYKRWTKTKPLKDIDIFCVLAEEERHYRKKHPSALLAAVETAMVKKYDKDNVSRQRRSVSVSFGVKPNEDEETEGKVMSFDVVPAFDKDNHYEIPDTSTSNGWTETDPEIHYEKALEAQNRYDKEWKGIVRMVKKWNDFRGKPLKPSFLIEVMSLELLVPPFGGDYRYEVKGLFAAIADRIHETWPDPAGLGPPVSDSMDRAARDAVRKELLRASDAAAEAIQLERNGRNGDALRAWREQVFGKLFPLS
jgi:hypothetical protein